MRLPLLFNIRIKKHQILKNIYSANIFQSQKAFEEMIRIKDKQPKDLYGYYVRAMLQTDIYDLQKETAMEAIAGIPRRYLMSRREMKIYHRLPKIITIYRGTDNAETNPRFSWSLDINVARNFYKGTLFSATIEKDQIIALFYEDTDELEVVVNLNADQVKKIEQYNKYYGKYYFVSSWH